MEIIRVLNENDLDIENLIEKSIEEKFTMLQSLIQDYHDNPGRFNAANSSLLIAMDEYGTKLGIGSLSAHPTIAKCARIQHHYVLPQYRNMGVGYELIDWLIRTAKDHYDLIVIEGNLSQDAQKFYNRRGFEATEDNLLRRVIMNK